MGTFANFKKYNSLFSLNFATTTLYEKSFFTSWQAEQNS
jgi:hypothetical protein